MSSPVASGKSNSWIGCVAAVALFWGHYGVSAKFSQNSFHHIAELTFFLVCVAYTIGIAITLSLIKMTGDHGVFPQKSKKWSAIAGLCGAGGAVFVVLAMKTGNPVYVMPLVFGPAQAFNVLFTRIFQGKFRNKPNHKFWGSLAAIIACSWLVQQMKSGGSLETMLSKFEFGEWMLFSLLAASCWGLYGVSARLALFASNEASPNKHGSHLKPLLVVCIVYFFCGVITFGLGFVGLTRTLTGEALLENGTGFWCGLLTGACGFLGAAFAIPANGAKGPGPIVAMAWVFLGAAAVNAVGTIAWELLILGKTPQVHPLFVVALIGLAVGGYVFSANNPNRPPAKK